MRKNSILTVGALALALGLGYTAMNATGVLPQLRSYINTLADEGGSETTTYLSMVKATPAKGASFAAWQMPSVVEIEFTNGNPGTFDGVEKNKLCTEKITVTDESGNVLATIDPQDASQVYVNKTYTNNGCIALPESLKKAPLGKLTINVPAGVWVQNSAGGSLTEDGADTTAPITPAITIDYTIGFNPEYHTVPASGQSVSTLGECLDKVQVNYGEGTTLKIAESVPAINLYYCNPAAEFAADQKVLKGSYTPTVNGTSIELTLTLADENSPVAAIGARESYMIEVPAGCWNVSNAEGSTGNFAFDITDLSVVWLEASTIEVDPPTGTTFTSTDYDNIKEFSIELPGKMEAGVTSLTANLYKAGSSSQVATYKGTMAPNGKIINYVMDAPTSATSSINRPEWWDAANYVIKIAKNQLKDPVTGEKNTQVLELATWTMTEGLSYDPITKTSLNPFAIQYGPDSKVNKEKTIEETGYDAVSTEPGVSIIRLTFLKAVKPNPENQTAKLALYKEGVAEPIFEQTNNGESNWGHVYFARPTVQSLKAMTAKTGSGVYITYDCTQELDPYASTTSKYAKMNYLNKPGTYTLKVEPGYFVTTAAPAMCNEAIEVTFTILGEIETTVLPANSASVESIKDITITYPEGTQIAVKDGAEVELQRKDTNETVVGKFGVSAAGNVVTLSLPEAFGIPYKYGYNVIVKNGLWTTTYNGITQPNAPMTLFYDMSVLNPGSVSPSTENNLPGSALQKIVYTSLCPLSAASGATLYKITPSEATPAAEGEETEEPAVSTEVVATYTASTALNDNEEKGAIVTSVTEVTYTTDTDLSMLAAGTYVFEVNSSKMTYINNVTTEEDFRYTYEVEAPKVLLADHIKLSIPSELEANITNSTSPFGFGMSIIVIDVDSKEIAAAANPASITMNYSADGKTYKEIGKIDPANEEQFAIMGANLTEDGDGVIEFDVQNAMYLLFAMPGTTEAQPYLNDGYYQLVIPDGAIAYAGIPMEGLTLVYHYENKAAQEEEIKYTINPADGETLKATSDFYDKGIEFTFEDCSFINYEVKGGELLDPKGAKVYALYPQLTKNSIIFKFGYGPNAANPTVWEDGTYQFTLKANTVMVNTSPYAEDGNFPTEDIKCTYILQTGSVGVALIGIAPADSYNVYTLDGKTVKLNATAEEILDIESGLYIVNGQKVHIVK